MQCDAVRRLDFSIMVSVTGTTIRGVLVFRVGIDSFLFCVDTEVHHLLCVQSVHLQQKIPRIGRFVKSNARTCELCKASTVVQASSRIFQIVPIHAVTHVARRP